MDDQGTGTRRAIVIAGPTASGKSALALRLAEELGGVVINADSMQVYADLRILTARPTDHDMARVPHRLFGHVDAAEAYSVGRWLDDVRIALRDTSCEGSLPIFVGGSGLYLKALTQGLSAIPAIPPEIRRRIRAEAEGRTAQELHAQLQQADSVMASRLRTTDPQRIIRALEILSATGLSLSTFQQRREAPILSGWQVTTPVLAPDRRALNAAIERRTDGMVRAGALAEVQRLQLRALDPALPAMRALGVPPLLAHLRGDLTEAEATDQIKLSTRRYAKRQVTFARHNLPRFREVAPDEAYDVIIRELASPARIDAATHVRSQAPS